MTSLISFLKRLFRIKPADPKIYQMDSTIGEVWPPVPPPIPEYEPPLYVQALDTMKKAELQDLARTLEVKYTSRDSKAVLITKITNSLQDV